MTANTCLSPAPDLDAKLDPGFLAETLRGIAMFALLSDDDIASIASTGSIVQFPPGATLMREGEAGNEAFAILSGHVKVERCGTDVVRRGPGDCLGEISLLDSSPRSATVTAVDPVRALVLRRAQFEHLLAKPVFVTSLLLALSGKVREGDVALRGAWEQLNKLARLKDDLVQLILHDLRNPLGNMVGTMSVMQSRNLEPSLLRLLEAATCSGRYMQRLLEEVLEVSRLEQNGLTVDLTCIDLRDVGREAALNFTGVAALRGVDLKVAEGQPVHATADHGLVRRVLENFIANALRYSPANSTVEVSFESGPEWCCAEVADHGPGVPPSMREAVFRKFGTLETGSNSDRRGYGLGLHLANLVATSHNGSVSVHDNPGGGAIFRLCLPARKS